MGNEVEYLVGYALVLLAACRQTLVLRILLILFILLWMLVRFRGRRSGNTAQLHLVTVHSLDEVLLLECRLAGQDCLFLVDTGYAGPSVLSASYLAVGDPQSVAVDVRYKEIVKRLRTDVDEDKQHDALNRFLATTRCKPYTSGCTMRLMSIGSTQEQQADMLLCDRLEMRCNGRWIAPESNAMADVFVTHPLPMSVHILTCDYLIHNGPSLLEIGKGKLHLNLDASHELAVRSRVRMQPHRMSGGAFVVRVRLSGIDVELTVDTGAPGGISVSQDVAIKECKRIRRKVEQVGVNGERMCSELIAVDVDFSDWHFGSMPVLINDSPTEDTDGFVGMGFLRGFDIFVAHDGIGFVRNNLEPRTIAEYSNISQGECESVSLSCDR